MGNAMRGVCTITILFFLFIGSASAQQASAPAPSPTPNQDEVFKSATVLHYTTRLVLVDVIATDHKGNPVTGLKKEDFTLEEDGEQQQIAAFNFQTPSVKGSSIDIPKLPPNIISNAPQYDVTRSLSVLLLDGLNTESKNQVFARQQMIKFLQNLPAGQPVAVYTLGTKLLMLQDFTSDPAALKNAVMAFEAHNSPVLQNATGGGGNSGALDPGTMGQLSELPQGATILQQIQQFEQDVTTMQTDMRVQMTLAALTAMGRRLAAYPGRKNLIWLTQSFPLGMLANSVTDLSAPSVRTQMNNRDYSELTARTASFLTDAQVALYPVDVGAVVGDQIYSSLSNTDANGNYLGRTMRGRSAGGMQAMTDELNRTGQQQMDVHASMNDLADRTGGKALYGRNNIDAEIHESLEDGSTYYTLAYHPENKKWNGKFRKISVKVSQPGVKLRYRLGYYAIDPESYRKLDERQRTAEFQQALNLDFPISTAITFRARVFPPSEQTKNNVIVNFGIDPHAVVFEPGADGQHAEMDYAVAAYSKGGKQVKVEEQTLKTALAPDVFEKIMKTYLPCQLQLKLPSGEYILRLGVRDNRTGLLGTLNTTVTVP